MHNFKCLAYLIFLTLISCQSINPSLLLKNNREVASIFGEDDNKTYSRTLKLWFYGQPKEIKSLDPLKFNNGNIVKIEIKRYPKLFCVTNNTMYQDLEKFTFIVEKKGFINCTYSGDDINKPLIATYYTNKVKLNSFSENQKELINEVIGKIKEEKFVDVIDDLTELGILQSYFTTINSTKIRGLNLKHGDFVSLWIDGNEKQKDLCLKDHKCIIDARPFGVSDSNDSNTDLFVKGLKYKHLPPFLLFCGSIYPASNIVFRADEDGHFDNVVGPMGLNCDVNNINHNGEYSKISFTFKGYILQKEKILADLKNPELELAVVKNQAIKNQFNEDLDIIWDYNYKLIMNKFSEIKENYNQEIERKKIDLFNTIFTKIEKDKVLRNIKSRYKIWAENTEFNPNYYRFVFRPFQMGCGKNCKFTNYKITEQSLVSKNIDNIERAVAIHDLDGVDFQVNELNDTTPQSFEYKVCVENYEDFKNKIYKKFKNWNHIELSGMNSFRGLLEKYQADKSCDKLQAVKKIFFIDILNLLNDTMYIKSSLNKTNYEVYENQEFLKRVELKVNDLQLNLPNNMYKRLKSKHFPSYDSLDNYQTKLKPSEVRVSEFKIPLNSLNSVISFNYNESYDVMSESTLFTAQGQFESIFKIENLELKKQKFFSQIETTQKLVNKKLNPYELKFDEIQK